MENLKKITPKGAQIMRVAGSGKELKPMCLSCVDPRSLCLACGFGNRLTFNRSISQGCQVFRPASRYLMWLCVCLFLRSQWQPPATLQNRDDASPTNSALEWTPRNTSPCPRPCLLSAMGLFGVLICHLLKKKGYRCTRS